MANEKVVVVLSDLHCGSDVGLMPPVVETEDGQTIGHGKNPWQSWLWKAWVECLDWISATTAGSPFILLLNGDLIEGIHHRSDEVLAAKIVEHCTIAKVALAPVVKKASTVLATRGTECHTRDLETYVMRMLGHGKAHDFIQLDVNGVLIDVRHHMPVSSRIHLEASPMSILAANNRSNAIRNNHKPPRVFLRGHRHTPGYYCDGDVLVGVTGAWQGLTRHGKKVVPDAIPRPSCLILDHRNSKKGELPHLLQKVFSPPQSVTTYTHETKRGS